MKTAVIIQARMGSTRLPGKVLMDIGGKPMLQHVIERCRTIAPAAILAVPDELASLPLEKIAYCLGVPTYFGSEMDVLQRYVGAAREHDVTAIMRITADCPLLDPSLCQRVGNLYNRTHCGYAAIDWPRTYPKGMGCEVFSAQAARVALRQDNTAEDHEHVTPWMQRNLKCEYLTQEIDQSHMNFSVDTLEDLNRVRSIYAKLNGDTSLAATVRAYEE